MTNSGDQEASSRQPRGRHLSVRPVEIDQRIAVVLREQLLHLAAMAAAHPDTIELRVLPFTAPA